MIGLFGAQFGFLYPALLAAAPVVFGLLIYAYLKRGRGTPRIVPTLLLLRSLKQRAASRSKFVPPVRFFFELLLLSLLIAAAAGLFREDTSRRFALLVDNSLSMAAHTTEDGGSETVLSLAKHEASGYLAGLPLDSKIDVFTTTPRLTLVNSSALTASQASEQINELSIAYGSDRLEDALQSLAQKKAYDRIAIFSERQPIIKTGDDLFVPRPLMVHKEGLANIVISNINLRKDALANKTSINVSVTGFLVAASQGELVLEGATVSDEALNFGTVAEKKLTISPGQTQTISFDISDRKFQLYRATLKPDRPSRLSDSIEEDNIVWLSSEGAGQRVALVSTFTPEELKLAEIPSVHFERVLPENWTGSIDSGWSAAVFHRYAPSTLPKINSLFVLPPKGNALFDSGKPETHVEITRWQDSHPLISYLNLPALQLTSLTPLIPPPWAKEILSTTSGAAIVAGEYQEHRYGAIGFEIFPYEGKSSPITSILTLNTLKWLSDLSSNGGFRLANSTMPIEKNTSQIEYVGGDRIFPGPLGKVVESVSLPSPGVLAVNYDKGTPSFIAVNYFDAQESNTLDVRPYPFPAKVEMPASKLEERGTFVRNISKIVFLLLLLDLRISLIFSKGIRFRSQRAKGA